ncbi:hypothetical protein FB570_107125 [Streptomyces sp. T12]|nr:hypothetical protein FB570_107125 [Streptomyces sp. T12]
MMPTPRTTTSTPGGTITSTPPMIATALTTISRSAKFASRRSISPPPQKAKQLKRRGAVHRPLRWKPLITATAQLDVPGSSPPTMRSAQPPPPAGSFVRETAGTGAVPAPGRSRVIGASSP